MPRPRGTLSLRIDWYVIDVRRRGHAQLNMEMGEALTQARLMGIRPMPIERLLPYLGYDMSQSWQKRRGLFLAPLLFASPCSSKVQEN